MAARLATLGLLAGIGAARFIPEPQGVTKVLSEKYPGASIEYKRVCPTTGGKETPSQGAPVQRY